MHVSLLTALRAALCLSLLASAAPAQGLWDLFGDESIFEDSELWKMRGELRAQYAVSGWSPAPIEGTTIETTGLNIATVELDLQSGVYDRLLLPKLPSIRYDWTPGGDNELQRGLQQSLLDARERDSFTRLVAGSSLLGTFLDAAEEHFGTLDVDYELFAFSSAITLHEDKLYVPFEGPEQSLAAGETVTTTTLFERWRVLLSVLFQIDDEHTQHTLDLGIFLSTYQKPYSLTIEGVQDASRILDAKFSGAGVSFNYRTLHRFHGEEKHGLFLKTELGLDFGPGEVEFADGSNLSDSLPPAEQVLFIGANADADLEWTSASGLTFSIGAGARYFNFQATEGGYSYANVGEVDVNEDFVWFAQAGLVYSF